MRIFAASVLLSLTSVVALAAAEGYTLLKTVPVPGDGGWDYLIVDDADRRVYISHGTQVDVLDADTYELKGTIKDEAIKGVHGIALAPDLGRGRAAPRPCRHGFTAYTRGPGANSAGFCALQQQSPPRKKSRASICSGGEQKISRGCNCFQSESNWP
jgi:hypothetical protein